LKASIDDVNSKTQQVLYDLKVRLTLSLNKAKTVFIKSNSEITNYYNLVGAVVVVIFYCHITSHSQYCLFNESSKLKYHQA